MLKRELPVFVVGASLFVVTHWVAGDTSVALLHFQATLLSNLVLLPAPLPAMFLAQRLCVTDSTGRFVPGLRAWRSAWVAFRGQYLTAERALGAAMYGGAVLAVFSSYTRIKTGIPGIHPYAWDAALARVDQWLHGGMQPWVLIHPIVGHPGVTRIIEGAYLIWMPLLVLVVLWQAWSQASHTRLQFFLSLSMTWLLLGGAVAAILSSGGPCYFSQLVDGPDPYSGLMEYLRGAGGGGPLFTLQAQQLLWDAYVARQTFLHNGISAMPSIHVAVATLFVPLTWTFSKRLALLAGLYLGVVMIGSVHLGWHYAVDGYAAILGALLIWRAADFVARSLEGHSGQPDGRLWKANNRVRIHQAS